MDMTILKWTAEMRNLQLLYGRRIADCPELSECRRMAVDYDTGVVYCGTATQILGLDPVAGQVVSQADLGAEGLLAPDGSISIVGLQNIPDQMSVCAATSKGDVVLWNTTTGQIECVGSVEQGLTAMAWSPDQELLVLSTGNNTLILMTRDFDPITEVAMHQTAFGEAEFINVGWGKKETQFHGAVGKQAAHVKSEAVKPAHAWDDLRPRITWRGDGQYFAVSSINPLTNGRIMHVWTREGVLHSTSESVDGMEQALSWKPSGSLIASTQRKPNKHDVMFYERNGLQHGEFTLPFGIKEVKVCEVSWNVDSSVLAVWCEELPPDGAPEDFIPKSYIQLWTVNNYHWYLKQSLSFERTRGSRVVDMCWDPSQVYRLHVICHGGQYLQYTWSWATNHSWGNTSYDLASVAVIDGDRVLMTPLRETVVPPPMSAYHLQMSSAVNHVAFAPPPESNDVAVLLQDGSLHLYIFNSSGEKTDEVSTLGACGGTGFAVQCTMPTTKQQYSFKTPLLEEDYPFVIQHMSWVQATQMLLVTLNMMGCGSEVHLMTLDHTSHIITESSRHEVDGFVIAMATNPETGSVALQLQDGGVLRYDTEEGTLKPWETDNGEVITFPSPCPHIAVTSTGGEEVVIGLTERFRCYVNNCEVASNCTSFSVHEEFILLTTHSHTCRCISRHTKVTDLPMLSDGKAHPFDESIRQVERGSRIVCVVPDDSKLVLQMPRGNLETIHPRALVLTAVRKHLDRVHFKDAFMLMRKHRINMNLLHDHNPGKFLENTDLFVSQLEVVNFINLFLTDLQEEDVTETMYTGVYQSKVVTSSDKNKKCKVDTVCDAVRLSLEKTDSDKYLLSILTAHVRKSTPELEIALQRVKTVKGDSQDNRRMVTAEEALKYLLFLVDVNELYDVALGTYDFELVMMVAEKSQKDPKEYLPFLNNLRKMETNYQHYTIDKYLKRYSKALTHISKCGSDHFDECLALVTDHRLFAEALKLFQPDCQHYKDIASAYGDYLRQHSHRQEAGLMFMKAQDWVSALTTFEECLNWRQALCVATCLEYSEDKMAALCRRIAGNLKDHRRHTEAACLYEQYAQDIEEAIVTLIEGHEWEESLRLMYRYKRLDFIDTNLRPALSDAHKEQTESLQNSRSDFERYFTRLEVVRQEKEKARLEILEGGGAFNDADADLFSDTSSATGVSLQSSQGSMKSRGSSVFTKTSGRSSKNKKKAEKKKWSLKEGSPHEDVALIEALSKIIKQVEDSRGDIASLLKALVQFGYIQEAEELQQELESFLGHMEKMTADIWTDEQETTSYRPVMGPDSTANSISAALQQGRFIKSDIQIDSHLKVPPAMSKDTKWKQHVLSKSSK